MKFETIKHHYLIYVDGHTALLDLGSPFSFATEDTEITLGNKTHNVIANPGIIEDVNASGLIKDRCIDMLIGMDILCEHRLFLDKVNEICIVDDPAPSLDGMRILPVKVSDLLGHSYVTAKAKFNGVDYDFILDTGAWIGYASSSVINGNPVVGTIHDYNPMMGDFETSEHIIDLQIAGYHDDAYSIGLMPPMLSAMLGMIGVQAVMGIDDLVSQSVVLDLPNSLVAFV